MGGTSFPRRVLLTGCCATSVFPLERVAAADEESPQSELPQTGDQLVEVGHEAEAKPLRPEDLRLQDLVLAWAYDPRNKIVRNGSRLNMVLLMRFDPAALGDAERQFAPGGIVAYSAVCTHQQCWVTDWLKSSQVLQCPCHQSQYDLRHGAKVVGGPAPRSLPALPLKVTDGVLDIAGPFTGRVGGEQQQGA
jgi:rieske iron-sulfur protein